MAITKAEESPTCEAKEQNLFPSERSIPARAGFQASRRSEAARQGRVAPLMRKRPDPPQRKHSQPKHQIRPADIHGDLQAEDGRSNGTHDLSRSTRPSQTGNPTLPASQTPAQPTPDPCTGSTPQPPKDTDSSDQHDRPAIAGKPQLRRPRPRRLTTTKGAGRRRKTDSLRSIPDHHNPSKRAGRRANPDPFSSGRTTTTTRSSRSIADKTRSSKPGPNPDPGDQTRPDSITKTHGQDPIDATRHDTSRSPKPRRKTRTS